MLRVMSANLFNRFVDVGDLARALDSVAPDLLVALEMVPEAAAVIDQRFAYGLLEPDPGFTGWGVASSYPGEFWSEPAWRGGRAKVDVDGHPLHLAAAHITDPIFGRWPQLHRVRARQVDALLEWGESRPAGEAQVLMGDMNASPAWEVYKRLSGRWDDLVLTASNRAGARPPPSWGPKVRLLRIDHVLGLHVEVMGAGLERIKGSDHSAVVVDLEVG